MSVCGWMEGVEVVGVLTQARAVSRKEVPLLLQVLV